MIRRFFKALAAATLSLFSIIGIAYVSAEFVTWASLPPALAVLVVLIVYFAAAYAYVSAPIEEEKHGGDS